MALVFVHGVNTRDTDDGYAESVKLRSELFAEQSLKAIPGAGTSISNPYWGGLACSFPWNMAFTAGAAGVESFGGAALAGGIALDALHAHPAAGDASDPLLTIARENLADAVDFLVQSSVYAPSREDTAAKEASQFGILASDYAVRHPKPDWLVDHELTSDAQFIARLVREVRQQQDIETFGVGDLLERLKQGGRKFNDWVGDKALSPVAARATPAILNRFSRFFGDVFVYLRQSWGNAQGIRENVENDLRGAAASLATGEKLIVVAHSMGGNIVYDLLTSSASDLPCDLFLTVGSQVALFEELKLFKSSDPSIPSPTQARVKPASNIKRWVNVFDPVDPFGYPAGGVFEQATDYAFDTKTSPLSAHGAYFLAPSFHRRLRARLPEFLA